MCSCSRLEPSEYSIYHYVLKNTNNYTHNARQVKQNKTKQKALQHSLQLQKLWWFSVFILLWLLFWLKIIWFLIITHSQKYNWLLNEMWSMNQNDRTQSNWIALKNLDQFKMEHIGAGFHCNALLTLKFTEQTFLFPINIFF